MHYVPVLMGRHEILSMVVLGSLSSFMSSHLSCIVLEPMSHPTLRTYIAHEISSPDHGRNDYLTRPRKYHLGIRR